jgi:hypothetical protein
MNQRNTCWVNRMVAWNIRLRVRSKQRKCRTMEQRACIVGVSVNRQVSARGIAIYKSCKANMRSCIVLSDSMMMWVLFCTGFIYDEKSAFVCLMTQMIASAILFCQFTQSFSVWKTDVGKSLNEDVVWPNRIDSSLHWWYMLICPRVTRWHCDMYAWTES